MGEARDIERSVRGKRTVEFPRILGHEIAGVVDSVGSAVGKFSAGDEVILSPRGYCGLCPKCRLGLYHYCEDTFSTGGDGGNGGGIYSASGASLTLNNSLVSDNGSGSGSQG